MFQLFMETYIETVRNQIYLQALLAELQKSSKKLQKARNSDLYYRTLLIDCYHFCQQCEENFENIKAKKHKYLPFATVFLYERINFN